MEQARASAWPSLHTQGGHVKLIAIFVAGWLLSAWLPVPQFIRHTIAGGTNAIAQGVK
jgi:hypothetical protein